VTACLRAYACHAGGVAALGCGLAVIPYGAAYCIVGILAASTIGAYAATAAWRHVIRPSWAYGRAKALIFAAHRIRRSTSRTAPHDYQEAA